MKTRKHHTGSESQVQGDSILVFGMRRSGTTWLAKIIDSHPDTLYRHEPDSWIDLPDVAYYPDIDEAPPVEAIDRFYEDMRSNSLPHVVAKAPFFDKNYMNFTQKYRQLSQAFVSKSAKRLFGTSTNCYNAIPTLGEKRFRLVWKSVESLGRLAYFASAMPDSCAVFLVRHPCGYFNSYLRGQAMGKMPKTRENVFNVDMWSWRLQTGTARSYGLTMDTVVGWSRKERMIWEWIIDNQFVLESVRDLKNVKIVVYDELCKSPPAVARQIFDHCRLHWNPQTENFLMQGKRKQRSAYFSVFKDPAVTADAWRHQLPKNDQRLVVDIVADTLPASLFDGSLSID